METLRWWQRDVAIHSKILTRSAFRSLCTSFSIWPSLPTSFSYFGFDNFNTRDIDANHIMKSWYLGIKIPKEYTIFIFQVNPQVQNWKVHQDAKNRESEWKRTQVFQPHAPHMSYTIHYTLYTIHCAIYNIHYSDYTLYTIYSTLYTLHYTLYMHNKLALREVLKLTNVSVKVS